jgi:hypothetical protein
LLPVRDIPEVYRMDGDMISVCFMYIHDMALGAISLPGALVRFLGAIKQLLGAT